MRSLELKEMESVEAAAQCVRLAFGSRFRKPLTGLVSVHGDSESPLSLSPNNRKMPESSPGLQGVLVGSLTGARQAQRVALISKRES